MALNVLFNDWISELSDDILSWLLLLFSCADWIVLIWLFDGFDCSWRFVSLFAEPLLMPQWLLSIFGHFGWWQRIFWGENRLSGVRGKRPSLRCWYWYLNHVMEGWKLIATLNCEFDIGLALLKTFVARMLADLFNIQRRRLKKIKNQSVVWLFWVAEYASDLNLHLSHFFNSAVST